MNSVCELAFNRHLPSGVSYSAISISRVTGTSGVEILYIFAYRRTLAHVFLIVHRRRGEQRLHGRQPVDGVSQVHEPAARDADASTRRSPVRCAAARTRQVLGVLPSDVQVQIRTHRGRWRSAKLPLRILNLDAQLPVVNVSGPQTCPRSVIRCLGEKTVVKGRLTHSLTRSPRQMSEGRFFFSCLLFFLKDLYRLLIGWNLSIRASPPTRYES